MKKAKGILIAAAVFAILALFTVVSSAAGAGLYDSLSFTANDGDETTVISTQIGLDGTRYLFLPSSADLKNLVLYYDSANTGVAFSTESGSVSVKNGVPFDLTSLFTAETDEYVVTVTANGETSSLTIMKSANVRSMYLVSADPENKGREWVDTDKSNKAKGKMSLVNTSGELDYSNGIDEIKGRGNATFRNFEKKPYQIKLQKKAALIGGDSEKSKKWVLLANAADNTLLHNTISFALANALGMAYTPNYEPIDLYYDGEYRGSYLLCEKTEVGESRIDIDDLDDMVEDANKGTDAFENPVYVTKTTASGGTKDAKAGSSGSYKYAQGLKEPAYPDGASHHAYLLEVEYANRYTDEPCGFVTTKGQAVVTKSPEDYLTKESGAYISSFWQEFEDAVYSPDGYNRSTGKYYYEYCDLDSLVNLYLINELGKNWDGFKSSTFFYLPADSDMMYAGPVWDYDICYGNGHYNRAVASNPENFFVSDAYLVDGLLKIESFRNAVKATLNKENGKFYNAVRSLLGDNGIIAREAAIVNQSQKLNFKMWDITSDYSMVVKSNAKKTYENSIEFFKYFVENRVNWLSDETSDWNGSNYKIKTDTGTKSYNAITAFLARIIDFFNRISKWFSNLFK